VLRAAGAYSLLETSASQGWRLGLELERALLRRVPVIGASLVLNHPRLGGTLGGYPYERRRSSASCARRSGICSARCPAACARTSCARCRSSARCERVRRPAVGRAHGGAAAGVELRGIDAERRARRDLRRRAADDAVPPARAPESAARPYLGLGLALRLWRDSFPIAEGGTAILMHRFHRHFSHPTQQPYRAFFAATRGAGRPTRRPRRGRASCRERRARCSSTAAAARAIPAAVLDWDGCRPALGRLGNVLIAGCRDHAAARQLGFVPTHGLGAALTMVRGWSDRPPARRLPAVAAVLPAAGL
jgi:hypothetical protein